MHTLVRVKNAYTVMTICLIALGAALLFAPQLGLKDFVHVVWSVSHNIWSDKAVRIFCKRIYFSLRFSLTWRLG